MKEVQQAKLKLNKKVVAILSDVQQKQVKGGVKAEAAASWFLSFMDCNTITCCSLPSCSLGGCHTETVQ